MYLSFLEVIHIGGLLANQPKNVQCSIRFQRESKASFSASPRLRSRNRHTSNLLTVDTSERRADLGSPWRPRRIQTRALSSASPDNFLPLLSHSSSLGDTSSVRPNSFHPRSGSVPVRLFAVWRAGKPLWE